MQDFIKTVGSTIFSNCESYKYIVYSNFIYSYGHTNNDDNLINHLLGDALRLRECTGTGRSPGQESIIVSI